TLGPEIARLHGDLALSPGPNAIDRVIGGPIIHDDDLVGRIREPPQRLEAFDRVPPSVPVDDDHRDPRPGCRAVHIGSTARGGRRRGDAGRAATMGTGHGAPAWPAKVTNRSPSQTWSSTGRNRPGAP